MYQITLVEMESLNQPNVTKEKKVFSWKHCGRNSRILSNLNGLQKQIYFPIYVTR